MRRALRAGALAGTRGTLGIVPAGTRNHFALDLGLDRADVVGALDAYADGLERYIDLAEVNGRVFVNNVSLGIYAEAVQRAGYRDAKLRTLLDTVPDVLGPEGAGLDLSWRGPGGHEQHSGAAVLVSNNRYRLGKAVGSGTRPRIDEGLLGLDADRAAILEAQRTLARFGDRVILRQANFSELYDLARDAGFAQRRHGCAGRAFREFLAVLAEDQTVVDELGGRDAERLKEPAVELLVRAMVETADDMRDPEVRVVDDAREVIRRSSVLAQQRDPVEALAELCARFAVAVLSLALPYRPVFPLEAEPLKVADDLLLPAGHVPLWVGVVDPQEHPVP